MRFRRETATSRREFVSTKPSRTDTSKADETDINFIVNKFMKTGQMLVDSRRHGQGSYADVSIQPKDLMESYHLIRTAENAFAQLPAKTREFFLNDPANVIDFLSDPNNRDKAVELGLIPKPESVPQSVEPVTPPAPAATKSSTSKSAGKTTTNSNDDE